MTQRNLASVEQVIAIDRVFLIDSEHKKSQILTFPRFEAVSCKVTNNFSDYFDFVRLENAFTRQFIWKIHRALLLCRGERGDLPAGDALYNCHR